MDQSYFSRLPTRSTETLMCVYEHFLRNLFSIRENEKALNEPFYQSGKAGKIQIHQNYD